jgi:hypothetical protein
VPSRAASGSSSADDVIDRLYSLDPDEFTGERNEAAKRLKAEGDNDGAGAVKGLRKPTAVAWAVNQLPRRAPERVEALLDAGASLRSAQRAALSGSGKGGLREATQERRAAVAVLVDMAAAVFSEAGRNPAPHVDAVRLTLEAASSDESVGELLRAGRFTKEVEPSSGLGDISGFEVLAGGLAGAGAGDRGASRGAGRSNAGGRSKAGGTPSDGEPPMDAERSSRGARPTSAKQGATKAAAEKDAAAEARVRERQQAKVAKAEDAVMAAREAAKRARGEAGATAKEADRLERELETARRRADRAAAAADKATAKVEDAERALAKTQEDLASLS